MTRNLRGPAAAFVFAAVCLALWPYVLVLVATTPDLSWRAGWRNFMENMGRA